MLAPSQESSQTTELSQGKRFDIVEDQARRQTSNHACMYWIPSRAVNTTILEGRGAIKQVVLSLLVLFLSKEHPTTQKPENNSENT